MSVLASLIAALERANGDQLVLCSGDTPHVLAGGTRHDLGTTKASVKALEALAQQILSPEARQAFGATNAASEPLSDAISPIPIVVGTQRSGDQIRIELQRVRPAASVPAAPAVATSVPGEAEPAPVAPPDPVGQPAQRDHDPDWQPIEVQAAQPVATESPEVDQVTWDASAGEPATPPPSVPAAAEVDAGALEPSMPPAVDPAPDTDEAASGTELVADEASSGSRRMKVVPIGTVRTGAAKVATDSKGRSDAEALEYWIRHAARRDATELYLRAGHPPLVRVRQKLQPLDDHQVDRSVIDTVTAALAAGENDWSPVFDGAWTRELDDVGRVTCQTFIDDRGVGLGVHLSSRAAASALCKDIPRQLRRVCEEDDGLVIVSAPALPDAMQMVAALGEWTAQRRAGYLVSIEPPNGLGHDICGILVSARRFAGSERDVADAIRRAMHEGPDILVIALASGSIAEEAIRAAQSGCLVIVGAIAPTASQAIENVLKSMNEEPLRQSLAASFRCGFSYRTVPGRDGSRAVVQDLLIGTSEVRARLERGDLAGLDGLQRSGAGGMRSLDAALAGAVHRGETTLRRAAGMAIDRHELVRLVRRAAHARNRAARGQSSGTPGSDPALVPADASA